MTQLQSQLPLEERRREKPLMEDGRRFIRVEWKDLFREQEFKNRILDALRCSPPPAV